jgi:DNA end-binding protein Ku
MARAMWKGSIAFGLVQIPVSLNGAEQADELSFHMLDKRDLSPIGYDRINKRTGKKVDWAHIVKGYEHAKGEYVVLTDEDFEAANIEATHTIDIDRVVDLNDVDPMFFERPYYVAPDKQGKKAYALLRDTLAKSGKVAIAKVVIRTRQHLAALVPRDDLLVLILLRFAHELKKPDVEVPRDSKKLGITPKEREMAETLVHSLEGEWKPGAYKDEFRDDLLKLIHDRVDRGEVNSLPDQPKKKRAAPKTAKVIDLMSLLAQSVEQKANSTHTKRKRSAKATRPAAKKPRKAHAHRPLKKSA